MDKLVALFRFVIGTALVLAGALLVVVLLARLFVLRPASQTDQLAIPTGSNWSLPPLNAETRRLSPTLMARAAEINAPASDDPTVYYFPINTGDNAQAVAQRLHTFGLITDATLFTQLLRYNSLDTKLQAGDYYLRRNMTMRDIGAALYRGRSALRTLTIPPGMRTEQLADYLAQAGVMDGPQFLQYARQGTVINHSLLADRPAGASYEGYLFPGTYLLPNQPTPPDLIYQMLDTMARQLPANADALARQQGLTLYQVLIVASIVEREAALDEERPVIASVYLNRLKPGSGYPYLQADPTVQYAMGYQLATGQWWKSPVQLEEYAGVDSPYNTYMYSGLPPGPIASPRLKSILAVLQPANTNYLFFVCRRPNCQDGEHVFAATYTEHLENVNVYWGNN
jgi:UPF0755 protein